MGRNETLFILMPEAPPSAFVLKICSLSSRPYRVWWTFIDIPGQCGLAVSRQRDRVFSSRLPVQYAIPRKGSHNTIQDIP